MNGDPMSVDGSAISGRDSSFDRAREWFGIVVGYALNVSDGSVYEENITTGISRRTHQPANLPHHSTVMDEVTANPSDLYYPFVIRDAGAFFQLVEAGTLGYTDAESVYQCSLFSLDWENNQDSFLQKVYRDSVGRTTPNWIEGSELKFGMSLARGQFWRQAG